MADSEPVVGNDRTSSLIEQLGKALLQLQACKDVSEDMIKWVEIEGYFHNLDTMLKKKIEELEAKEKEYEEKKVKTLALVAEREAAIIAKEQDFLDRVQELKDVAVAVIAEARANYNPASLDSFDGGDDKDSKVSSSLDDTKSPEDYSPIKMGENTEGVRPELTQICEQMDAKGLLSFTMEHRKHLYVIREELSVALESAAEPARLVLDSLEGFYPPVENTQPMDKMDAALQGMRKCCIMFMEAMSSLLARIDPGADHLLNPEIKQQAKAIADEWKPKLASAGINATNGNSLEADAFLQLLSTFRIASEFDEEELCKLVLVVACRRHAPELCRSLGLTHKMPGVVESLINSGKQIDAVRFIHTFQLTESFRPVPLLKTYLKDCRRNAQGKGGNLSGAVGEQGDVNAQELAALKAVIRCVEDCKLEAYYPLDSLRKRAAQLDKLKVNKKRAGDFGKYKQPKKQKANGGYRGYRGGAVHGADGGLQAPPAFIERITYTGMPERYPKAGLNTYDYQVHSQPAYGQQASVHSQSAYGQPASIHSQSAYGQPASVHSQSAYGQQAAIHSQSAYGQQANIHSQSAYSQQATDHSQSAYGQQATDQRMYYYTQDGSVNASSYDAASYNYGSYMGTGMRSSHQPYM